MRSSDRRAFSVAMSFCAIAFMRFLSRSMIFCRLSAIASSSFSADFEDQLPLQVTLFADPVCLGRVGEPIARDRRRRYCASVEQLQHTLQMGAVAGDVWA